MVRLMIDEKKLKQEFKKKAQKEPEKYYPVETLKSHGFRRFKCKVCGTYFWSVVERDVCGDPNCSGGYKFIDNTPAKVRLDYIEVWERFKDIFKKLGYEPINRYPVVARWRDDVDFVQASIYDFQPYCVTGEVEPPANPLVVPQFCLRFNDIENVGITGRHYTGFVMIGQHAFEKPENFNPNAYLEHIYIWLTEGLKIPKEEIQFHEDAWAGGGNLGLSMEFFSRGLEIGNQVYMTYEIVNGEVKELEKIKVLDMGMGQERPAWFTNATSTSYDSVFGDVIKKLFKKAGIKKDEDLFKRFLPYSGLLNVDEADVEKKWVEIAEKIDVDVEYLKKSILPIASLYSIADHSRSLLVALNDGALPSNVGGGYNLRVLIRRSLDYINKYNFDLELAEICEWHAEYLSRQYPELKENLDEIAEILDHEKKKYYETRKKAKRIVSKLKKQKIDINKLIELYDSHGISPEMLKEAGLNIEVPPDFYIRVAERHEKTRRTIKKFREFDLSNVKETEILYYDDYLLLEFEAKVLKIIDNKYVVLDRTAFYPTSGGQACDKGYINKTRVVDVFKQGRHIIHRVEGDLSFKEGDTVKCRIDKERRIQLAQHHTGAHIINGVARLLLGEHVWQAGAEKDVDKARLDITHYKALSDEEVRKIERLANEIIEKSIPVESYLMKRNDAEAKYGFRLYQGGAVPGKIIRVVKIGDVDVEACGGTHLKNTSEARLIKIISTSKIKDDVVRIEFTAGKAAIDFIERNLNALKKAADILNVNPEHLPRTVERFFNEWKALRKEREKLMEELAELNAENLKQRFAEKSGCKVLIDSVRANLDLLNKIVRKLLKEDTFIALIGRNDKTYLVCASGGKVGINAAEIVKKVCSKIEGKGGGKPNYATGVFSSSSEEVKNVVKEVLREAMQSK